MEGDTGMLVPAAEFLERQLRWSVIKYQDNAPERRVRNWTESAKIITSHYRGCGWDTRVTGLDPVLLKDLNLNVAHAEPGGITRLAARLSDSCKVLHAALDIKNHGVFVPAPSMFGCAKKRTIRSHCLLADLTLKELQATQSDQPFNRWVEKAIAHSRDMTSLAKWFYSLGLGMVPLPASNELIADVVQEGSRALNFNCNSEAVSDNPEKLISLAYLLLACRFTGQAISEIARCTGAESVYSICERKPKWMSHSNSLLASFSSLGLAEKAKLFIYNDLYDVVLTLKHVRLRSMIKKALVTNEELIQREVAEYRSAGLSVRRKLQEKTSLSGAEEETLDIQSLLDLKELNVMATERTGPIEYFPEGLNEFMLTNLRQGENDGTLAGKIGRDLFCGIFSDDLNDANPIRKINGYTARVLLCGEDVIIVEPIRRTLTVVLNDPEWGKDLAPCIQMLQADVRTPRIRLKAELVLCMITGASKESFRFLENKYSENQISYSPEEFKEVYMQGRTQGVEIKASDISRFLERHTEDPVEAAVFRETVEMFSRYSTGLQVQHETGKGCYKEVLYKQGIEGSKEKLNLDVPIPLIGVVAFTSDSFPGDGYLFADEVVFDCTFDVLGVNHWVAHISGTRELKDRKGLTVSWRLDACAS